MLQKLSVADVKYIAHKLARNLLKYNEPIPPFNTRFPNKLESCLITPFISFGGKKPYPTLRAKAAILFYLMIKNHPFENGNKRVAVTTLLLFLSRNEKWLRVDDKELYNFAKWVAESNPKLKDATVEAINKFLALYMVNYK
ncbi:MAG: type II toxin-antitoxin system death-on-curing family toxin [Patescibacteria group bacterium]